jgi:hypothetical protein
LWTAEAENKESHKWKGHMVGKDKRRIGRDQ